MSQVPGQQPPPPGRLGSLAWPGCLPGCWGWAGWLAAVALWLACCLPGWQPGLAGCLALVDAWLATAAWLASWLAAAGWLAAVAALLATAWLAAWLPMILDPGSWAQDSGSRVLHPGFWTQYSGSTTPPTGEVSPPTHGSPGGWGCQPET